MKTVERFSPSNLAALEKCPGWIPEPKEFKQQKESADEGKLMHTALETGNLAGLHEEQRTCVAKVRAGIDRATKALEAKAGTKSIIKREFWLELREFNKGIADELAVAGKYALVSDAKFGFNLVEDAETNPQGISYALATFETFPDVEEVTVKFYQPRCNDVSTGVFDRKVYHTLLLRLKTIRANVQKFAETQDPSLLRPIPDNCAYCGNLADCPAIGARALMVAQAYDLAHERELPGLFHPSQLATPERRAQAEVLRRVLDKWCASVQKHNLAARLAGEEIPGYELKTKKADKSVTNPVRAWEVAQALTGEKLTQADLAAACTISLPKLKDVIAVHAPKRGKAKMKQELENQLKDAEAISAGGEIHYLQKIK